MYLITAVGGYEVKLGKWFSAHVSQEGCCSVLPMLASPGASGISLLSAFHPTIGNTGIVSVCILVPGSKCKHRYIWGKGFTH